MNPKDMLRQLKQVSYLADLSPAVLAELITVGRVETRRAGARIVSEMEQGADVYIILSGRAEVWVEPRAREHLVLDHLGPGQGFGEMSSLTGELRSATVTATEPLTLLRIPDAEFDALRERYPVVAKRLLETLSDRLTRTETLIEDWFQKEGPAARKRKLEEASRRTRRGTLSRAWYELVTSRKQDLPFLTLAAFLVTLVAIRALVYLAFRFDVVVYPLLQSAYLLGFGLLILSAGASLLTSRPRWRRAIALGYGIGVALILNQLGVTLAFDIFYKDIFTPDPNVPFDIERLYRRSEPLRAITWALVILVQAVYLRHFYRRMAILAWLRVRRWWT